MRLNTLRWRSIHQQAWNIAFPVIVGGLSQNVITLIDTYFLGRYVGELALGAGGLAAIWYFTLIVVVMGLGTGLQVLVARYDGEGNPEGIGKVTDAGLRLGLVLSVFIGLFHIFISPYVLDVFCKEKEVASAASEFLFWRAFDVPFTVVFFLLRGYLNGIQRNKILIYDAIITTIVNGGLCYLFVYQWQWGIKGAAIATLIAEFFAAGILVGYIWYEKIHIKHSFFRWDKISNRIYHELVKLSLPTAAQFFISMGSFFFFINIVEKMGVRPLAASELVKNIYILFMIPTWGFGTASGAIVSNLLGQKKVKAVLPSLLGIIQVSFLANLFSSLMLILFPTFIVSQFTNEPALVAVAVPIMPIIFISLLLYSISGVMLHAVIGSGATKFALKIEVVTLVMYVSFLVFVKFVLQESLQLYWISEFIYMGVIGVGGYLFFKSQYWKNIAQNHLKPIDL